LFLTLAIVSVSEVYMNQILFATNRNRTNSNGKLKFGTDLDSSCSYGTIDPCTREFKEASKPDFLKAIKGSVEQSIDVVSYFHGFKATFKDSVDQVAKVNSKFGSDKRLFVLFSWPSDGKLSRRAYKRDRKDAEKSGRQIAQFLDDQLGQLSEETTGKINVMCQSLGNRAFEYAVSKIKSKEELGEVVLSAPVIPRNAFESGQNLEKLPKICDRVSLYFNPEDFAKYLAGILGEINKMSLKGPLKPLKLDSNVAVINCDDVLGMEHRYLYESFDVIFDVNLILDGVPRIDQRFLKIISLKDSFFLKLGLLQVFK
jgi:esterase/lipase superfamily enzyme